MSDQQDPKNVDANEESKASDQLANEQLDEVVGGTDTVAPTAPTISTQSQLTLKIDGISPDGPGANTIVRR